MTRSTITRRFTAAATLSTIIILCLSFAPVQAKSFLGIFQAAWSPDGTQILFDYQDMRNDQISKFAIYTLDVTADTLTPVELLDQASSPAWSPDGRQIAFSQANEEGIYVMNTDGSGEHVKLSRIGYTPKWSPDGKQLTFQYGNSIYLVNADGSEAHQLVGSKLKSVWNSFWSPNGQFLTLVAQGKTENDTEIYRVDLDGENLAKVADSSYQGYELSISPDGSQLAVISQCDGHFGLCLMDASDGSNPHFLSNNALTPVWSPDGSQLAYIWNAGVCIMSQADLTGDVKVTVKDHTCITKGGNDSRPIWSPDGSQLIFFRAVRPDTAEPDEYFFESQAYIINADGSNLRQIPAPVLNNGETVSK
ncbi:MAG TPA: hypothetical protein VHL11_03935 [Phototrophicaceae bacterium]|jgi:Tol biopolymer transport system component|nr:hypothetical protein [Phototrophicaceae bacterium]